VEEMELGCTKERIQILPELGIKVTRCTKSGLEVINEDETIGRERELETLEMK
jgi:hypothetical protein